MADVARAISQYNKRHGHGAFAPRAVLFDMDGVLYDSMPNHARAWHESMSGLGIEMSGTEAYIYEGMRGIETIQMLCERQKGYRPDEAEASAMYKVKSSAYSALGKAPIMPGVQALMRAMHESGLTIGIVTGSGQETLLNAVVNDFAGMVSRERMVTSFDVTRGKPDPMPYIQGLRKTGVEANQAMVVENAPLGVRAAVAAGIFTIAVNTGPLPDSMLADEGADIICHDMTQLLGVLPSLLGGGQQTSQKETQENQLT